MYKETIRVEPLSKSPVSVKQGSVGSVEYNILTRRIHDGTTTSVVGSNPTFVVDEITQG